MRRLATRLGLLVGLLRAPFSRTPRERRVAPPEGGAREANVVSLLLLGVGLAAVAFVVAYVLGASTQALGGALAAALLLAAVAAIVAGKNLVAQEEIEEELPSHENTAERSEAAQVLREGSEALSRRRLLMTGGIALGATGAAAALPMASLGPVLGERKLTATPWREGRRLVDERGEPLRADDLEPGTFLTAFAESSDPRALDSSVIVVRVPLDDLDLPEERRAWAPDGIVAYSKSCTHAGCAVSLFRYPLYDESSPGPRMVCPCHYSSFDPTRGGKVTGGPAGRDLPQLPLRIEAGGVLVAAGALSEPPGPSWSGVRE